MTKEKRFLKIGAGILALILILLLFLFMDSLIGNPISAFIAKRAAIEYADRNFSSFDLELGKARYSFKFGEYYIDAKSKTSQDTHFTVTYHRGGRITDDFASQVLTKRNTAHRFQESHQALVRNALYFMESAKVTDVRVSTEIKAEEPTYQNILTLDMPFDKEITIPYTIFLDVDSNTISFEKMNEICQEFNRLMKENQCQYYDIWLGFNGEENFSIYRIQQSDIESGRFIEILKENFDGAEGDWQYHSISLNEDTEKFPEKE